MTTHAIETPDRCPLCCHHIGAGSETEELAVVVLDNKEVIDCKCWHLLQIEIIRGLNELPSTLLRLRAWWHRVREYRQFLSLRWWAVERRRLRRVEQHHSGEVPAVEAPDELEPNDA